VPLLTFPDPFFDVLRLDPAFFDLSIPAILLSSSSTLGELIRPLAIFSFARVPRLAIFSFARVPRLARQLSRFVPIFPRFIRRSRRSVLLHAARHKEANEKDRGADLCHGMLCQKTKQISQNNKISKRLYRLESHS
jgi:hypothetical protein